MLPFRRSVSWPFCLHAKQRNDIQTIATPTTSWSRSEQLAPKIAASCRATGLLPWPESHRRVIELVFPSHYAWGEGKEQEAAADELLTPSVFDRETQCHDDD